jgi:hypothetical protein
MKTRKNGHVQLLIDTCSSQTAAIAAFFPVAAFVLGVTAPEVSLRQ